MKLTGAQRKRLLTHPAGWIASGFGAGFAPAAPGTVGSAAALLPYLALRQAAWWWTALTIVVVFAIGVRCADWVIREVEVDDPGVVVIDEWIGQWITLLLLEQLMPLATARVPPIGVTLVYGFLLFRLCDIVKPWPASWADRKLHGGFGTMLDDAIAGVWAGTIGLALIRFL
jgi:phosphatidylglycerophosphatase A